MTHCCLTRSGEPPTQAQTLLQNHSTLCYKISHASQAVFKTKTFDRWAKKLIVDSLLCKAALEIEQGLYEADLGQGVCKKRIAVPGRGKSGSTRTLVAKQHAAAIVFLVGREKSEPGPDFPDVVVMAAQAIAQSLHRQKTEQLEAMAADGKLKEICNDKKEP